MPLLASARSFGVVDVFVNVTMTSLRSSIAKRYGNNARRDDTKNSVADISCCCESELNRVKCMTTSDADDAYSPRAWCYRLQNPVRVDAARWSRRHAEIQLHVLILSVNPCVYNQHGSTSQLLYKIQ